MHGMLINGLNSLSILVYPSLESEEDNPVFKSRSKKRKSSDDTPYSPTGKHVQYFYKVAAFKSLVSSVCSNPVYCCHHSPCRTLGSSARATSQRRRPSGLHRNRTGCSCSKAFASGIIISLKFYMMLATIPVAVAHPKICVNRRSSKRPRRRRKAPKRRQ